MGVHSKASDTAESDADSHEHDRLHRQEFEFADQQEDDNSYDHKMNALGDNESNGPHGNGRPKLSRYDSIGDQLRNVKTNLEKNVHLRVHIIMAIIILLLGITLIAIGIRILVVTLRNPNLVCESSPCLQTSARILSTINTSVDPCQDFYRYACTGWRNGDAYTNPEAPLSTRQQVEEKIWTALHKDIDEVPYTLPENDALLKVKKFYQSCMDLEDIDYFSLNMFVHTIQGVNGWRMLGSFSASNWDQAVVVERLHTVYGVDTFFKITVGSDDLDPNLPPIIKIYPSGLGLPSRNYYYDAKYKSIAEAYKQYLRETVKIFPRTTEFQSKTFAEDIFNYEKRLSEIMPEKADHLRPETMFKRRFSIRELKALSPSIKWSNILQTVFKNSRLNDNTRVLVYDLYLANVSNIISTTDNHGLNDYLIWRFITTYAPYLSREFRIIHDNFQQALHGATSTSHLKDENRWKFCLETTSKFFGFALSSLYINNRINEISNITVQAKSDIVDWLKTTLLQRKDIFVWNNNEVSRQMIDFKVRAMQAAVGQPSFVLKQNVAEYYNEFIIGVKFVQNIFEAVGHAHKKMEMALNDRKKLDYAWPVTPHSVELAYDYASNRLYVPIGFLQPPFYDPSQLASLQFGAIGFHLALHMLKAFDLTGLHYGLPNGRLTTNSSFAHDPLLRHGLSCLTRELNYYNSLNNNQLDKINDTLSSTYIDFGALRVAQLAYQSFVDRRGDSNILPVLPFNPQQLFFISLAQTMCGQYRLDDTVWLSSYLETSNQLPEPIRLNSLVRQNDYFNQAFSCPRLDVHRVCHLWN